MRWIALATVLLSFLGCAHGSAENTEHARRQVATNRSVASIGYAQGNVNEDFDGMSPAQIKRAQQITTFFENGSVTFQYDYIENLGDGRGFTAGRVGFCTGTGDLIEVVESYCKKKSLAELCTRYLRPLRRINGKFLSRGRTPTADTGGLKGFPEVWTSTAQQDSDLKQAQDDVVNQRYFFPALNYARKLGIRSAMGKEILYDTIIMHGDETRGASAPDSIHELIDRANQTLNIRESNEREWLNHFLDVRRADLQNPSNHATRAEWSQNVWRIDQLRQLLRDEESLDRPVLLSPALNEKPAIVTD